MVAALIALERDLTCANFFKILPNEILIAHDELDLQPGIVRLKLNGGHGGHNGLRDIFRHLHGSDFYRLRIGIGHPGHKAQIHDYVLNSPGSDELGAIEHGIGTAVKLFPQILKGEFNTVMNILHQPL